MTAPDREDRGADGQAMAARPRRVIAWQRRISATRVITERREVMADVLLIDRMHLRAQITDRQYDAACRLYGIFLAAGLLPRATGRLETPRETPEEAWDGAEEVEPQEEARLVYRRLLRDLGPVRGVLVDGMMLEQHPGAWMLEEAQLGLDELADLWGMEKS